MCPSPNSKATRMGGTNHDENGDRAICEAKIMEGITNIPITVWEYREPAPPKDFYPLCKMMRNHDGGSWCIACPKRDICIFREREQ